MLQQAHNSMSTKQTNKKNFMQITVRLPGHIK